MLVGRVALIHGTAANLGISKYNGVSSYLSARVGGRSFKTESTQIKFLIKIHKTVYHDASFRLSPDKTRRWYVTFPAYQDTVQLASSQTSRWFMCCDAGAHTHRSVRCLAPRQQLWLLWSVTRSLARFFVKEVQILPCSPSIGSPFTSHCIAGLGFPLARHTSLPSSPGARMRFWGSSNQYGAALKYTNAPVMNAAILPHPKSPLHCSLLN